MPTETEGNFSISTCFHRGATVLLSACEQMKLAELIVKAHTFSYNVSITGKHLTLEQLPTGDNRSVTTYLVHTY